MTHGLKNIANKLDVTLMFDSMPHALTEVVRVLSWAVHKRVPPYQRDSWLGVDGQYFRAARMRHTLTMAGDQDARDDESGLLELAHIATNALMELQVRHNKVLSTGQTTTPQA